MTPDKLAEIKARHEAWKVRRFLSSPGAMHVPGAPSDRADLLAYVETLTKERDEARRLARQFCDVEQAYREAYEPGTDCTKRVLPWEVKP